ncbi:MAG TPA: hypothetical protein VLR29_06770 [Flavobacterium sp.]|nr:hypothetical protein [Flavobacterium sp.]
MIVNLASASWGPQFLVPTIVINKYSGRVVLRETFDEDLLKRELDLMNVSGHPEGYNNAWYVRRKGIQTWTKIGESSDRQRDFAVCFDSTEFKNGKYQILGFMSIKVKATAKEVIVSRQNIADLEIRN